MKLTTFSWLSTYMLVLFSLLYILKQYLRCLYVSTMLTFCMQFILASLLLHPQILRPDHSFLFLSFRNNMTFKGTEGAMVVPNPKQNPVSQSPKLMNHIPPPKPPQEPSKKKFHSCLCPCVTAVRYCCRNDKRSSN